MEIPILSEVLIILGLSVLVILIFFRLKLPTILGFLITGVIAGPYGLKLVSVSHEVEVFAEIGVISLLFIIGLEFSLKTLATIKRTVLVGGTLQVFLTIAVTLISLYLVGFNWQNALFMGFLFSLSSTAIVLKSLQDSNEINTPHGKVVLGILIYQDIIVVAMMLVSPMLGGNNENLLSTFLLLGLKLLIIILITIYGSRYFVPRLLFAVARTKSKELFVLAIVVICFSVAWLTSAFGLSLALGAFLAGLIISESEYSHQATSNILPFREIFSAFFFVSIGMLLDIRFFIDHVILIIALTLLVGLLKFLIAGAAALALKYPLRTAFIVGMNLFQVGEFAFILSATGIIYGLISTEMYQYFLAISILSMAITPFSIKYSNKIADKIVYQRLPKIIRDRLIRFRSKASLAALKPDFNDHLVIIGFGINGKNVARAARFAGIPYVIVELNPESVQEARISGEPIIYGDAVNDFILTHLHIATARVVVIAISDPVATKKILVSIRDISKSVHVIIRTRFVQEIEENMKLGGDEVIPEEFETSIEIFSRVLNKYLVPMNEINKFVRQFRSDAYEMLRPQDSAPFLKRNQLEIPHISITCVHVERADPQFIGKPLKETKLRETYGITLIAIKREGNFFTEINADIKIKQGDLIYIFGKPSNLQKLYEKLAL
jgi:monovalent cation:H+ antiporter-2, CPA2 family